MSCMLHNAAIVGNQYCIISYKYEKASVEMIFFVINIATISIVVDRGDS